MDWILDIKYATYRTEDGVELIRAGPLLTSLAVYVVRVNSTIASELPASLCQITLENILLH